MPKKTYKQLFGMDAKTDSTMLPEGKVQSITNMMPTKTAWVTRTGLTKFSSTQIVNASPVQGLGRYYTSPGIGYEIGVANGNVKWSTGGAWTTINSSLHATNLCQVQQFENVCLIHDQYSGVLAYSPVWSSPYFIGIPSPKTYKLIESFEEKNDWTVTNGTAYDDTHVIHGSQSVRFISTGAVTMTASKTITATGLDGAATFGDGSTGSTYDQIVIFLIRGNPQTITSCKLRLYSGAADYWETDLVKCKDWQSNPVSYAGLDLRVRRSAFAIGGGTPTWTITQIDLVVATTAITSLICDFLRLEKTSPIAHIYGKHIASFDNTETWTADSGAYTYNTQYKQIGNSIDFDGNGSISRTGTWNLTTFDDEVATAAIDDIQIYLGKSGGSPTVTLTFYKSYAGGIYARKVFTGLPTKTLKPFSQSKATGWTVNGGFNLASDWATIERIDVTVASAAGQHVYVDELNLVKHINSLVVSAMEPDEGWTITDNNSGTIDPVWAADKDYVRGDEGSINAFGVKTPVGGTKNDPVTAKLNRTGAPAVYNYGVDMSNYSTGIPVQTTDMIGCWMYVPSNSNVVAIDQIELRCGTDTTANYFSVIIPQDQLIALAEKPDSSNNPKGWFDLHFARSAWTTVGGAVWTNITWCAIIITKGKGRAAQTYYFDQWSFKRSEALKGSYQYAVSYVSNTGEESDLGQPSDPLVISGGSTYLTGLPVVDGSFSFRVVSRNLYRIGGTQSTWKLVDVLSDNSSSTYVDTLEDGDLGQEFIDQSGQPWKPRCLTVHDKQLVIGNLTSQDGLWHPAMIQISNEDSFESFQAVNTFEIEPDTGFQMKWLHSQFDYVFVGKEDSIWKFDPKNLSLPPHCETRHFGGVSPLAVCGGPNEFYFLDKTNVISYNGSSFDEHVGDDVKPYIDGITASNLKLCWMAYYDQFLLVGIPYSSSYVDTILACYHPNKERWWFLITGWNAACALVYKTVEGNVLHLGNAVTSYVHQGFSGNDDDGTNIGTEIIFPDDDFGVPELGKDFAKIFIYGKKETSSDATLTISPRNDCATFGSSLGQDIEANTVALTSLVHNKLEIAPFEFEYFPTYLGLEIVASKRWTFRGMTEIIRLLEPTFEDK